MVCVFDVVALRHYNRAYPISLQLFDGNAVCGARDNVGASRVDGSRAAWLVENKLSVAVFVEHARLHRHGKNNAAPVVYILSDGLFGVDRNADIAIFIFGSRKSLDVKEED